MKIFNVLGLLGFIFFVPLVLYCFGLPAPLQTLGKTFGIWASPLFLLLYFYFFILLDLFFGSDRPWVPLLTGLLVSFLLFSLALPLGFMDWYQKLLTPIPLASCSWVFLTLGLIALILGLILSYAKSKVGLLISLLVTVCIPLALYALAVLLKVNTLPLPQFTLPIPGVSS